MMIVMVMRLGFYAKWFVLRGKIYWKWAPFALWNSPLDHTFTPLVYPLLPVYHFFEVFSIAFANGGRQNITGGAEYRHIDRFSLLG